ncbi:hypothetical protein C7B61_19800 [filamentous cyanobacterium CCP1]|nr:hypothetical protein C7B61_19800 [filamentous cyanobacterium CCP1]
MRCVFSITIYLHGESILLIDEEQIDRAYSINGLLSAMQSSKDFEQVNMMFNPLVIKREFSPIARLPV